jgi:hypothetical protein
MGTCEKSVNIDKATRRRNTEEYDSFFYGCEEIKLHGEETEVEKLVRVSFEFARNSRVRKSFFVKVTAAVEEDTNCG